MRILQHDPQGTAQVILFDLVDINAVIADFSVLNIIKAVDQIGDRCFTRTGAADKGDLLSRRCEHLNIVEHDLVIGITEIHIVKNNITGEFRIGDGAIRLVGMFPCPHTGPFPAFLYISGCVFLCADKSYVAFIHFRRLIHQFKDTVGAGKRHHNRIELLADLGDGLVKVPVERQERNQCADGEPHIAVYGKQCACDSADHITDMAELGAEGHQNIGKFVGVVGGIPQAVIQFSESGKTFFFMTEHLDDFLSFHHFFDITVDFSDILLLCHKVPSGEGGNFACYKHHYGNHKQSDNCQRDIQIDHADKYADQGDHTGCKLGQADAAEYPRHWYRRT